MTRTIIHGGRLAFACESENDSLTIQSIQVLPFVAKKPDQPSTDESWIALVRINSAVEGDKTEDIPVRLEFRLKGRKALAQMHEDMEAFLEAKHDWGTFRFANMFRFDLCPDLWLEFHVPAGVEIPRVSFYFNAKGRKGRVNLAEPFDLKDLPGALWAAAMGHATA